MNDGKQYVFQFNVDNSALNSAANKIETKLSEAMRNGMSLDRSGKAEVKQSLSQIFGIAEEQAETLRKAMQGIVSMKPEGVKDLKNQLKETLDFVSGIMTQMKKVNSSTDWMKQGIGFVDSFKTLQTALENTQTTVSGLETSVGELKSSFQGFADAFKANDPSAYFKKFGDGVDSVVSKMEGRLKRAKTSIDALTQSGKISPGDFSGYSVDELNNEYKVLIQTLSDLDAKMAATKTGTKEYKDYLIESADALADLQAINKTLSKNSSQGMNTVAADVVATIKQAGEDLKNTIANLKLDNVKLSVELPDANAAEFNAQVDDFVKQATQKFQGKPIEVSVDLISPFKDAKADTLPAEHEKKARELAEKFVNAYNEAISQKDGADKKAKEAIDISGQLSALYDPSVSSVLMKFWDSWNKIYDSVKAGQTTLLEATKNWKQKMTEELKLKFVWFNEDAAEGVSDLFERINQMAEKNPVYLVPQEDYLIGEIEKVLANHKFSLNVDLGDARIPINVTGGSGGYDGVNSDGTQPTPPTYQPPTQTPPVSNNVPDVSSELAETVDEMRDFAYTAESISEVVTRLTDNVGNISAKIQMLSKDIDDLDLEKVSDDDTVQKRKEQAKAEITIQKAALETFEQQKKEQEEAYEVAKKAKEVAQANLNAEKARRDQASQALRAERDTLFADNRTGKHSERILALNAQIEELEAPFESSINALEDAYNKASTKLLTIANSIRVTSDNIIAANNAIDELKGTEVIKGKKKELDNRNKELTAEKSKQAAFQSILDKDGNPVSLITDRLITFWESTDKTIESSRNKMEKLSPKLFAMENELKELQYELDDTDEEQDKDKHSALQERVNDLKNKISEAEKAIDQKALVKYRNYQKDANRASTRQDWMRAMGLGDIRDLGADEALEVITSVLQHYPSLAASLSTAANGKVNIKGLNIVKQLIDFIPDVQSTLGVVATTASESNEELLLKETFVNLFRIADQLNALDGLVDKKTGEVAVEALSGFITAFEKMPQMATVVQKAKALQKSTDELSDVLNNNDQLKEAFDIGEAKKYLTESFYDLWKALPDTVRGSFHHKTLNLDRMNSVDKADDFVRVVYDEFVRAFSVGKLNELKIDSPEWQSVMTLLKQGAAYANHEKATKGLKDSVIGADGIKRSLYELLHSADPIHVRVVGRDGTEHDYGVQNKNKAKMDVEHTYGQTPRSLNRAANKFRITDLLTEKFTIEKGIDAEILQLESELVALDQRISTLDKEEDKRQIERLSTLRETKQNKLNHLKELSATEDGRRQYEKESARRIRAIDEEIFGKVALSTKRNAPKRKARRDYEYGDHTINKVEAERDKLKKEKERLEREIAEIEEKDPRTDENGAPIASKAARVRLQEVESLLAVDNAQKMAIESVRALDKDIETNTAKWKESENNVKAYTRSLEALADAERKKNVLKDTKDDTFNKISRSIKQGYDANTGKSSIDYTFQVAKQYGTMDKELVEELEAKVAERNQLIEELEAIPLSQRYGIDKNGKEGYTGRALELATKIKELRKEIAQKYSEAEGSYLTNLLAEQLEQIDTTYDKQESNAVAQSDVKSSDYKTQVDEANAAHQENVAKINATIETQKAYYANLIGKAQQESDKITEEWQEKVRQLNAAETKLPQYMIDEQTKNIKQVVNDLEQAEVAPYKARLQDTFDAGERKELEAKIQGIQQKYAKMLNEKLQPILDEATRIDREVQAKDTELKTYYYNQAQKDTLALRTERATANPQRQQEIKDEIDKIELEYTKKYQEEIAKFKENLVRGFRQQMEEEARKVEEEGRKNAAQVLANVQKEAVVTYNKSESNTGKKVRVHTSIERELEAQRKAALEAEGKAHREALAQITQVDPAQIKQETDAELSKLQAEREAAKKAAVDKFKENGAYKTDETLVTEHITASKDAAEKKSDALNKELEQRKKMRQTLIDEHNITKEMLSTQDKVAKSDAKRVKVKAKAAQSSAAENNTPPTPKSQTPSGGQSGGSYGGFINTSGLAQESTLRGIWELLNGGAPANGWGDEDFASGIKEELDLSVKSFSGKLNDFASGVVTVANSIRNLPNENMALFGISGRIDEYLSGTENGIDSGLIKNFLNKHNDENLQLALHNHPDGIAALSPQDVQQVINTKKLFGLGALGSVAGSKITGIDISDINDDVANELLKQYKDNIRNSEFAEIFDDDFDIKEEFANSPTLDKQKVSDILNSLLQDAIRSVKLPVDEIYGQIDVSQLDEASRKVINNVTKTGTQSKNALDIAREYYSKTGMSGKQLDHMSNKMVEDAVRKAFGLDTNSNDVYFHGSKDDQNILDSSYYADKRQAIDDILKLIGYHLGEIKPNMIDKNNQSGFKSSILKNKTGFISNIDDARNILLGKKTAQPIQEATTKVAENIVQAGAQAAVESSNVKPTITQEEIDKYYAEHTSKFKTVQNKNGRLGYANDKFSSRVGQALLNSNVLNKDDSTFAQADAKRLQTAYDQIQQALAQEASKALGEDVITFLQKLQGEIAQKLQANGYGLEKVDTSPSALIKDTVINKDNIDKAKAYLGGLSGDEYKGSGSVETGLKWVKSVLSSTKQKLNQEDLKTLGNGYERLMRAVQSGLASKFDEDTQALINEAIKISQQVLEQYDTKVIGSGDLLGKEITEANKALVKNGAIGKIVTDMTNPAIMIGGKLKQQATASMQKQKKKEAATPQPTEEDKVTKAQREQEELTRKTAENKEKQAKATKKVAEAEKKVAKPKSTAPKQESATTPTYSAGSPQPTAGGGIPGLVQTLSQLLNVVAKDTSVQEIIKALGNGIKSTGAGGKQPDDGSENKSLNLSADEALARITAQVNADYPGAVKTGSLRANANSYSVDFWRDSLQAQKEAEEIQKEINKLEAEGKANTEAYNNLIQQRNSLLQKQEKITLRINKDTGEITSKVGIENFAVGANAAEKELQTVQGVLSQLQEAGALQFNPDGSLTSQNQFINNWIQSMQALQVQRDKFASEGTLFDSKNQQVLSQMTAQTAQYRKEIMDLLRVEGKFGGNIVDTFSNPQALTAQGEVYNKLLSIATATGKVKMETVKFDNETNTLSYTIEKGKNQVQDMTLHMNALSGAVSQNVVQTKHVDTAWQAFGKSLKGKWQEVARYLTTFGSIYRVWGMLKQGVTYIKDIDTALTELKKVTDATDREYAQFLKTMSKTAGVVGSTTSELTKSAADWARLGYSMEQAGELAKSTAILMNVSEFDDVNTATEALISSLQAFNYTADDSIKIVDKLNIVGNNFAISSDGIAEGLKRSASTLVAAGNSLEQSIAMLAAGNKVAQDPEALGNALKVLSMRIRGTKTELEEAGEETDGMITNTAKLRDKIMSLTNVNGNGGVDILTDAGAYRSTYDILLDIAEVWDDINDADPKNQAALLEILAGKTRGSQLAAILQNPEDLRDAYEMALESEGSAVKELETHLDSIQGKMQQFTNSVQTMWMNLLDSEVIKFFVDLGTKLVNLGDKIGVVNLLFAALTTMLMRKAGISSIGEFFSQTTVSVDQAKEKLKELQTQYSALNGVASKENVRKQGQIKQQMAPYEAIVAGAKKAKVAQENLAKAQDRLKTAETNLSNAQRYGYTPKIIKKYQEDVDNAKQSVEEAEQAVHDTNVANEKLGKNGSIAWANLKEGVKAFGKQLLSTLASMAVMFVVSKVIEGLIFVIDQAIETTEEAEEKFDNLNSEVSSLESEVESLNSELETTRERMEELLSMDSLSFVEEEELNNLKLRNAELERQLKLQQEMLKIKQEEQKNQAKILIGSKWDSSNLDKAYAMQDGVIVEDNWNTTGRNTKELLDEAIADYDKIKAENESNHEAYAELLKAKNDGTTLQSDFVNRFSEAMGINYTYFDDGGTLSTEEIDNLINIVERELAEQDAELVKKSAGINLVLSDMSEIIKEGNLSYSMDDDKINKFLDEYYAYSLKFANAQGSTSKSSVISAIWDNTESDAMTQLKAELDEVAESGEDRAVKEQKAQAMIQAALDDTTDKYARLETFMGTVGITAEEMANYFVAASQAPDMKSIGGILQVFADGEEILKKYKEERDTVLGQDMDGADITWNNLFTDSEDGKTADPLKIAAILEGSDEAVREQFTKLVEAVENGKMTIDEAFARWEMAGIDKVVENLNTEFEDINNELFKDVADEISGLIDTVKELQSALESVAGTMDTLHAAQEQMNSSGRISVKTALELMTATDEWDKILNITEDSITLKDGAEQALIQTQLNAIKVQTQRSAELAKEKYLAAQAAAEAQNLDKKEQNLANTQNTANGVTHARVIQMAGLETQTYNTAVEEIGYANNSQVVQTAESVKAKAIGLVSAAIVGLDAAINALLNEKNWGKKLGAAANAWSSAYSSARNAVIADANSLTTTVGQLYNDWQKKEDINNVFGNVDSYDGFYNYYDYDQTPGDKYNDDADSGSDNDTDWLEHYFTKIENKIKEKEADLENAMSADIDSIDDKNTIIDGIIGLYDSKVPLLDRAITAYKDRATRILGSLSDDIQQKILNGSIDIDQYDDKTAEKIQEYFDYITNASDLEVELEGIKVTIADFSLQKFDNASTAFDNEIEERFQSDQDLIEAEIGYLEEQGKRISPKLYEELINIQREEQNVLENKKEALENILAAEVAAGHIQIGDKQWYEMTSAINDVNEAIIESKNDIESFQNSINEIYWDNFEKLIDQIDAVNSELSNLFDLLSDDDKVVDEFGNWTDEGIASLGLLAQQMENAQAKADEYAKAIKDLDKDYADGKYSQDEYNEKLGELKDNYLSEIKNIEDLKDSMVDLNKVRVDAVKEAIDKEIEALEEKNEKLKEELELEKEQYDFQKQVAEQEKSMADIQRRLNALAGDTSASAIAERRKLEAELAEAQKEMDDMWYEHSIEEQQKSLDESLENYKENKEDEKEALDEWLEEEEKVIQESFNLFKSNVGVVASVLAEFEKEHGIKLSDAVTNPWKSGIDAMEAYRQKLAEMKQEQKKAKQNAEDAVDDIVNQPGTSGSTTTQPGTSTSTTPKSAPAYGSTVTVKKSATSFSRDGGSGTKMQSWVPGSSFTVYESDDDEVLIGRNGGYTGWVKLSDIEGYYKGTTGVKDDQWAFTDELGPELTLHAGPNGQLQYLTKGSGVVTADLTKRLMEWGELDPTKVLEQSRVSLGAPHITTNNFDIDLSFGSLVHVDHCDQNTLPDLQKMVRGEFDNMMKTLNQKLKRK